MRVSGENRAPPASWPYTGQSPAEACRLASRSSIDFPRDQVAQMAKLVLAAESKEAFDDAAVPVQQHGVRQPAVMICRLHAPPPTRMGNGGRNSRTNARILLPLTSSEIAAMSKSARLNSLYSSAMCGNSSRQGAHQDAQKFTSVTLPR